MKPLAIISVLYDYPSYYTPLFEKKLLSDFNSEDYHVIRYNSIEHNITNESYYYKFTYYRIHQLVKFIKEHILNKYEYFILLDATDVGYVGNISSVANIMQEYNCNILFGAERNLWPTTEYSHLYSLKIAPTPYQFLNAGALCASPTAYISCINNIISRNLNGLCDQGNWQIEYLLQTDNNIQLDYNSKLVLNTFNAKEDITERENNIIFKNNNPVFVHDNGGYNDETKKLVEYFV